MPKSRSPKSGRLVLASLKDVPAGTPIEEIKRAAAAFGLDFTFMKAVAKIESGFDPTQHTGSYIGLFQLSRYEFKKYGSGDILDARDNAIAAAYKFLTEADLFEWDTHKKADVQRPLFDSPAGLARRRRARRASGTHRLEVDVRDRRGQGKRREMVQTRGLGQYPSERQGDLEVGQAHDLGCICGDVAAAA